MKPVTVKTAGEASLARALAGVTTPLSQVRVTVTLAVLLSEKSLRMVKVALLSVLVIVHWPAATRAALQVPVELYPAGTDDSVAVQLGSGVKPVTVKTAGEASLAEALAGVTTPLSQTRETVTLAALLSEKSLRTEKVLLLSVLVIVHWPTAMSAALQVPLEV